MDTDPPDKVSAPAVRFAGVSKVFSENTAVESLELSIAQGEFFSLLGPSGCGKTTTLRLIAGFETPSSGTVFIDGHDVTHVPPYRRNVNTVFQSYALFPHLNVFENIAFGLRRKGEGPERIQEGVTRALEMVRMTEFEKRGVTALSGGQQQRVALARALVNQPKVLLLDEPLAALDSKLKREMRRELKELQRKLGITFVLVTHDQEEALVLSDRVAVLNEGRLQQVCPPRELYQHPANRFVAEFIGSANFLPVEVSGSEVRFQGQVLRVPHPPQTDHKLLMLRPESLSLRPGPDDNRLTAELEDTVFVGSVLRHHLRLADQTSLLVEELNRSLPLGESGTTVEVGWSPSEGHLLG